MPYVAALADAPGAPGRQVVVLPSGRVAATLEVSRRGNEGYRHLSFAPYAGGWLTELDDMGAVATLLSPDGAQRRAIGSGPGHVFSEPTRNKVVFTFIPWDRFGARLDVAVLGPPGRTRLGTAQSTAGFLGPHEVVVTTGQRVYRVDTRTRLRTVVPGISSASMVSSGSGLLIGTVQRAQGVFDVRDGTPILEAPAYRLAGFNPSGELVVGFRRQTGRDLVLAIADVESGAVIRSFRWRQHGAAQDVVWEDDRTLLVDFVRFRLDGTVERPRLLRSSPEFGPYLLPPMVS